MRPLVVVLVAALALVTIGSTATADPAATAGSNAAAATITTPPPEPTGFWTGPVNDPVPATLKGGKVIHTRDLAALLKHTNAVVVDVSNAPRRPENLPSTTTWLPVPHPGIPGAIWIPGA